MVIAVEEKRPHQPLRAGYPVDDPLFNSVTIPSSAAVSGSIDLRDFLPDLSQSLKKGKVIVMWSYRLTTTDGRESERLFGGFVLPEDASRSTR